MPVVTLANGRTFVAHGGTSVLDAAAAAGLLLEHSCRTGRCGACKARVTSGSSAPLRDEPAIASEGLAADWILTCTREASTDLSLDIDDLSALEGVTTKTLPSRIHKLNLLAPDVLEAELRLPPTAGFAFLAGQYIDVTGPGGAKRSYSIASDPAHPEKLTLHIKRVKGGEMSEYWFEKAAVNDLLRFRGPLGTFFMRGVAGLDLIFLVTGTGYAPANSMLHRLGAMDAQSRPASVRLLWGGRIREDIYSQAPCTEGLHFEPVLSRADAAWAGARGHVQDVLLASRPALHQSVVYACGSDAMIHSARTALAAAGLPEKRFYSDAFVSSN